MRRIIATEYLTLDGIFEDPGGGEETEHGGWSFKFWNQEAMQYKHDELFASDTLLLGRITYEGFAKAWPTMKDTGDFGEKMNSISKYVISTTLQNVQWHNTTLIKEHIDEEVFKLKNQKGKDILIEGSGELIAFLTQKNLIDEYRLMIHPIILGSGKRLFKQGFPSRKLRLLETKIFTTGIVVLHYQPVR